MITPQQAEFNQRIERITSGRGATKATVYVGQELSFTYVPKGRRGPGNASRGAGMLMALPLCLAAGFLGHGAALYAGWRLMPEASPNLWPPALAGIVLALVITQVLGLRGGRLVLPKLAGAAAGALFFHNIVHAYPAMFEQMFSPAWVTQVTSATEPQSLLLAGASYTF